MLIAFAGNFVCHNFDEPCLNDRQRTLHARTEGGIHRASDWTDSVARALHNRIQFGVTNQVILHRSLKSFGMVCNPLRQSIESSTDDLLRWRDDHCADSARWILAPSCDSPREFEKSYMPVIGKLFRHFVSFCSACPLQLYSMQIHQRTLQPSASPHFDDRAPNRFHMN